MDKNDVTESTKNNITHVDNAYFNLWITNYDPESIIKAVQRSIHNTLRDIGCEENAVLKTALSQISLCCTIRLKQISEPDSDGNRSRPKKLLKLCSKKLPVKNVNTKKNNSNNRKTIVTKSGGSKQIKPQGKLTLEDDHTDFDNSTFVSTASQNEEILNVNKENRSSLTKKNYCESLVVENLVILDEPGIKDFTLKRKLQNEFKYKEEPVVKCKRKVSVDSSSLTNKLNVSKIRKSCKENKSTSQAFIKRSKETTSNSVNKNSDNTFSKLVAKNNLNKKRSRNENSCKTSKTKIPSILPFEKSANKSKPILDSSSVVLKPNGESNSSIMHTVSSSQQKTNFNNSSNMHCRNSNEKKSLKKSNFMGSDLTIMTTELCTNKSKKINLVQSPKTDSYELSETLPTNSRNSQQIHVRSLNHHLHLCEPDKNKSNKQDNSNESGHEITETEFHNNKNDKSMPKIINVDILMSNSKVVPEIKENLHHNIDQKENGDCNKKYTNVEPPRTHESPSKHQIYYSELNKKSDKQNNCKGSALDVTVTELDKSKTEKDMPQIINVDIFVSNSKIVGELKKNSHNDIDQEKNVECNGENNDVESSSIHEYPSQHQTQYFELDKNKSENQHGCKESSLNITVTEIQNNEFEKDSSQIIDLSRLESNSQILHGINTNANNNIDKEKINELKPNNISDPSPSSVNREEENNVGKIRIKDISTLLERSESVKESSPMPEDASNVDKTNTTSTDSSVKNKIPKVLLQCFGKKDVRIMKLYASNFNELVESKIEIMGGLLHLGISDALRKQELLKSIEKLCDEQSIYNEKQRLETKFRVSMRQRGIEFSALLGSIVNRFEEDYVKDMFLALYVRLTEALTKIDSENKSHLHLSKNIIHTMLLRNSYKNQKVMSLLRLRIDVFRKAYLKVSTLVRFCHSFYTSEDGSVHKLNPIELEEQQLKEGIKVYNTNTLVLQKHLLTDMDKDKNSDVNSESTNSSKTSKIDIISNSNSTEERAENGHPLLVINKSQENTLDSQVTEKKSQSRTDQTCVKYNQAGVIDKNTGAEFVNYTVPSPSNQNNGNLIYISTNTPFISNAASNLSNSNIITASSAHCPAGMLVANKTVIYYTLPLKDKLQ